ncbi:MAG: tetratricopeptide repeat protein [Acidobacteria bacterium]|nr:tetratricopeptide repeat protein [Acidobacteriota bacterium]
MTHSSLLRLALFSCAICLGTSAWAASAVTPIVFAQEWRGQGRLAGKVVDESGAPLEGVAIKVTLPSSEHRGPDDRTSNGKGDWSVGGIAGGNWALDFIKDGYETRSISVAVTEGRRMPGMSIMLKKAVVVVDPNVVIREELIKAEGLIDTKQFAEARVIYERLAGEYPQVKQFLPLIARTYHSEGNQAKAIETLRSAVQADPDNVEVTLLLGNMLMDAGQAEEGRAVLASIDDDEVTDSTVYLNLGIGMINEKKYAEAITWFDRVIARFPEQPDAYYYRGLSYLSVQKQTEAKADLEKFVAIAPADAPELATARTILASIK